MLRINGNKLRSLLVPMLLLAEHGFLWPALVCSAQDSAEDPLKMSAQEIDDWLKVDAKVPWVEPYRLQIQSKAIVSRLEKGLFVSDKAVMLIAQAWAIQDHWTDPKSKDPAEIRFKATFSFIDTVIELLYARDALQARLLRVKASQFRTCDDRVKASVIEDRAQKILEKAAVQVEKQRLASLSYMLDDAIAQRKLDEREHLCLRIMAYPWYKVNNREDQHDFRQMYERAARELIGCRRGNLEALESIYLIPATRPELQPELDRAIEEAKK